MAMKFPSRLDFVTRVSGGTENDMKTKAINLNFMQKLASPHVLLLIPLG